jgi:2-dehydropantoate 2-reductase
VVYYFSDEKGRKASIPIGEVDGRITSRLRQIGEVLASMPGFTVELRTDMDAWLKTHVALLMPSLAPAIRAAGRDNVRFVHTRDAIVLGIRAIREGFCVLRALGYPIVPTRIHTLSRIPEPILVWFLRRVFLDPRFWRTMVEHGSAAQDEIKHLTDEFMALKRQTSVPTPAMDHLYIYFDPDSQPMPEGSTLIPMDWHFLWWVGGTLVVVVTMIGLLIVLFGR